MQKYTQAAFLPCTWLVRESTPSRGKAIQDLRSSLCTTALCAHHHCIHNSEEPPRTSESFNDRLFTISRCFYPTSTLSCPLTIAVSGDTLLLNRASGDLQLNTSPWEGGNPVKEVRIPQRVRIRLDYPDSSTHTAARTSNRLLRSPGLPPADHFVPLSTHIKN